MKYLFLMIFALLIAASYWLNASMPEGQSPREVVLYWTTDSNPARIEQIRLFDRWQLDRGLADDEGRPLIELRLDMGNTDLTKKIVQSVSGVAADTMDINSGFQMRFFQQMGVLEDTTDIAKALGFGVGVTFASLEEEVSLLTPDGERRQYAFPCNVTVHMVMANQAVLEALGMEVPPHEWSLQDFERMGLEFVDRANASDSPLPYLPGRRFFMDSLGVDQVYRSMGVDSFNETLTQPTLESPEVIEALRLVRKWTYEDRLLPSSADTAAMSSSGGYGGAGAIGFEAGRYGLFAGGRYHLIRFRQTNIGRVASGEEPLRISTSQFPSGGHPTTLIGTRQSAVYVDGHRLDRDVEFTAADGTTVVVPAGTPWAVFFQAFLASELYNAQIIDDADGLPPNPDFTDSQAYLRPERDPARGIHPETEYDVHGPHLEAAQTIADPRSYSPFILFEMAQRLETEARAKHLANPPIPGYETPEATMADAARRIRQQIQNNLQNDDAMRQEYDARLADQREIDRRKAAGEPIPARLVRNPFYLRLYRERGMLIDEGKGGPREFSASESASGDVVRPLKG